MTAPERKIVFTSKGMYNIQLTMEKMFEMYDIGLISQGPYECLMEILGELRSDWFEVDLSEIVDNPGGGYMKLEDFFVAYGVSAIEWNSIEVDSDDDSGGVVIDDVHYSPRDVAMGHFVVELFLEPEVGEFPVPEDEICSEASTIGPEDWN